MSPCKKSFLHPPLLSDPYLLPPSPECWTRVVRRQKQGKGRKCRSCSSVFRLRRSRDNAKLVSCGSDKVIFLWDVSSGQVVRKFGGTRTGGHTARINAVAFGGLDNDSVIVSGSYDTTLRVWDARSRSMDPIQILDHARDSISSVRVRDVEILSASIDGSVRIHDVRTGRITADHIRSPLVCARYSNDGNCILAASLDSNVRYVTKFHQQ